MRRRFARGLLGVAALAALALPGVRAAGTDPAKVFIASYGSDTNAGLPASPKRTFQAAQNAVATYGDIVVLDTAGYGPVTITKSLNISASPGVTAYITVPNGGDGIAIVTSGVVALRGLSLAAGTPGYGIGIHGTVGGVLNVEDCVMHGFETGILAESSSSYAQVAVRRTTVLESERGIQASASSTGTVNMVVTDCAVDRSFVGLSATAANPASANLTAVRCTSSNCFDWATAAINPGATLSLDGCTLTGSGFGVIASNGGKVYSRGNNTITNCTGTSSTATALAGY